MKKNRYDYNQAKFIYANQLENLSFTKHLRALWCKTHSIKYSLKFIFFALKKPNLWFYKSQFRTEILSFVPTKEKNSIKKSLEAFFNEKHRVAGRYHILLGENLNFSQKEVVVVAHFDPQHIVDPYVQYMCRHFRLLGKQVILASAGIIKYQTDTQDWADAILC